MKKLSKIVSVVLSLVLCLGMASPAFAASFTDLQNAIDGVEGTGTEIEEGSGRYGYGWNEDENRWGVEAWDSTTTSTTTDDEGNEVKTTTTTRNVQLKENVTYGDVAEGKTDREGITIDNKKVSLDLNDKTIDGGYRAAGADGQGAKEGGMSSVLCISNHSDVEVRNGTVTGGNAKVHYSNGNVSYNTRGGGVYVLDESKVRLKHHDEGATRKRVHKTKPPKSGLKKYCSKLKR